MKLKYEILLGALLAVGPLKAEDCSAAKPVTKPASTKARADLVTTAIAAGQFSTLAKALVAADLVDALRGDGPFTVFAPTDAAFDKLPKGTLETLLKPENKSKLQEILKYHVVAGKVEARAAASLESAKTLGGEEIKISLTDGRLKINQANVVKTDVAAANGLIHVIDEVLIPGGATMMESGRKPRDLIDLAIARGAPLFNDGQPGACAAIYEVAASALLQLPDDEIPSSARKSLANALAEAREQSAETRAWTLRHALDSTIAKLD